jgi:hypothetical protein
VIEHCDPIVWLLCVAKSLSTTARVLTRITGPLSCTHFLSHDCIGLPEGVAMMYDRIADVDCRNPTGWLTL